MDSLNKAVKSVTYPKTQTNATSKESSNKQDSSGDTNKVEYVKVKASSANEVIENLKAGKSPDTASLFAKEIDGKNKVLFLLERGRINQIICNVDASKADYEAALQAIKDRDDNSGVSDAGSQVAAAIVNDNMIPYNTDGYERVMLHQFQAMNFLVKKDLEGAGVEVRRANAEQEDALKRHEKEIEKAKEDAEKKKTKIPFDDPNIVKAFAVMDEATGKVKNSFQNAYTFYVSGIIYPEYCTSMLISHSEVNVYFSFFRPDFYRLIVSFCVPLLPRARISLHGNDLKDKSLRRRAHLFSSPIQIP